MTNQQSGSSFSTLGIAENFLSILKKLGYETPTPIQHQAIPVAMQGKDIIGIAQTGTGKTLAFGIPMIQRIAIHGGKGLVVLPTRELALQVEEVLHKIGSVLGLRTAVLIGGAPMGRQLQSLKARPHVVIATPGRLLDHVEQRTIQLHEMTTAVLDEADRMLDMGFAPQMKKILGALPPQRQIMLFSATMPKDIVRLATQHMKLPLQIEVAPQGTLAERVEQEFFIVRTEDKIRLLDTIMGQYQGTILIFSRTKHGAKKICRAVNTMGHHAAELHSNRSLGQRRQALDGFKSGKYRVLVATDIAARGIDVQNIELVINYDIPSDAEDYVHRIGRTGRAGKTGRAISFVAPDQKGKVRDIERLTRTSMSLLQPPLLAPHRPLPPVSRNFQPRRGVRSQSPNDRFMARGPRQSPRRDFRRGSRGGNSR